MLLHFQSHIQPVKTGLSKASTSKKLTMVILGVPELHIHVLDCLGSSCPGPRVIERTTLAKLTRTHLLLFSSMGGSCMSAEFSPN